jgi:copper(I)-binding protein
MSVCGWVHPAPDRLLRAARRAPDRAIIFYPTQRGDTIARATQSYRSIRMSFRFSTLVLALGVPALVAAVTPASAEDVMAGPLKISAAWARATPKGASIGGGYVTITNTGPAPDRLIGGSTSISGKLELHEMSMSNGVMKMRPVTGGLEIKPNETVTFKPGGYHLMFVGLKHQLEPNQHFKATLDFEKAGKVDVDFTVAGIGAMGPDNSSSSMGGMKMDGGMGHMDHGNMNMKK